VPIALALATGRGWLVEIDEPGQGADWRMLRLVETDQ